MMTNFFENLEPDIDLAPGRILFSQGEPGDAAYIVHSGYLDLLVGGAELTCIMPGEIVGEMALIENQTRFATAAAGKEGVRLYRINRDRFLTLTRERPAFALAVMKTMSDRLRKWGALFE